MTKIEEFSEFIVDRKVAVNDIKGFLENLEPVKHSDGMVGYRLMPLKKIDSIQQRCKILIQYTWHCRDYVKKILSEEGFQNPGQIVNHYIEKSRDVQVLSYLANFYKHAGIDHSQKWAVELAPKLTKSYVHGVMLSFPHRLKPTVFFEADIIPDFEFVGKASIGKDEYQFDDFVWKFSSNIVDKDGNLLGDAVSMCNNVFQIWLSVLSDNGINTSKPASPVGH